MKHFTYHVFNLLSLIISDYGVLYLVKFILLSVLYIFILLYYIIIAVYSGIYTVYIAEFSVSLYVSLTQPTFY